MDRGVTRLDKVRNEDIRESSMVASITEIVTDGTRRRWGGTMTKFTLLQKARKRTTPGHMMDKHDSNS